MKKQVIAFITGAMLFGTAGVLAGQYMVTENPFPIQLNGENVSIEGYNINDSTYFKLRDIADAVGGFEVDFNNNTIQLSKDGYTYDNSASDLSAETAAAALKQYANDNLQTLYYDIFDATYSDVKFMLTDFSDDNIPELLAMGMHEGSAEYMEIYYYKDGDISRILNHHCGYANGASENPVNYNGKSYVWHNSGSSSTGFLKQIMQYDNNEWVTKYSSHTVFDWDNDGELAGYDVNGESVSQEVYDAFNSELENSIYTADKFVSADEL